jgi:hypothetical protein
VFVVINILSINSDVLKEVFELFRIIIFYLQNRPLNSCGLKLCLTIVENKRHSNPGMCSEDLC